MEITSFVLGMLTITAIIILIATVVGLVKINKQEKQTESLHQLCAAIEGDFKREIENVYNNMSREDENIRRAIEDTNREVWKQFESTGRDVSMVEKTVLNQIESIDREHHKHEEELHREIDETKRYIDSRIDKVVLKGTEPSSKQILKG